MDFFLGVQLHFTIDLFYALEIFIAIGFMKTR